MLFPTTRASAIGALRGGDPAQQERSWSRVIEAYWRPVYKHLRLKWRRSPAEAEDLTQAFFAAAFEREVLGGWDPAKARFRTFLKVCVDRLVSKQAEHDAAGKRGGGAPVVPLDAAAAELELASGSTQDVEAVFEQEWQRSVFALALAALRKSADPKRFALFEAYDLAEPGARPTYQALGERFGLPVTTVTNHLAAVRRALKAEVLETLRELTADDEEFAEEAKALLGAPG